MRARIVLVGILALAAAGSGCSVYMAATTPDKKDVDVVRLGASRHDLLAELGAPSQPRVNEDGHVEDTWTFRQGDSTGWKVSRAFFHGVADFLTLGMWEVVGTPTEMLLKEDESTFLVIYDGSERATYIASLGGALGQLEMGEKPKPAIAVAGADAASAPEAHEPRTEP